MDVLQRERAELREVPEIRWGPCSYVPFHNGVEDFAERLGRPITVTVDQEMRGYE